MSDSSSKSFLGLGKTLFNSSVALIRDEEQSFTVELLLSERLTRKKACGNWPEKALLELSSRNEITDLPMAENRDVASPHELEDFYNQQFPFYANLESKKLNAFTRHGNPKLKWLPHHLCHAYAAHLISPYEKAIIVVMDGAGSNLKDFQADHNERLNHSPENWDSSLRYLEECSIFLEDGVSIKCVEKKWQVFQQSERAPDHWLSHGLGSLYEKSAEFIFGDKRAAGKVMGLATFGRITEIKNRIAFFEDLDWSRAFKGKGKKEWESSENFSLYCDIAASIQNHFETNVLNLVRSLHKRFPEYNNIILTGGCALNCTTNMKIFDLGIFDSIFVPPFPGDESIGLGAASYLFFEDKMTREICDWDSQNAYFGSTNSVPDSMKIKEIFSGFEMIQPRSIEEYAAQKIAEGEVIGWLQGRSEAGPRALGNRSILARVDKPGIKDYLNADIKGREKFRPYGCSVAVDKAHLYFEVPPGFQNPFMSFAVKTRKEKLGLLNEVTHLDGTCRMQTVGPQQNLKYYNLLKAVEKFTDLPCVLNTSLNVMGEPIVENLEDARNFLVKTNVDGLAIGDFYISKQKR